MPAGSPRGVEAALAGAGVQHLDLPARMALLQPTPMFHELAVLVDFHP